MKTRHRHLADTLREYRERKEFSQLELSLESGLALSVIGDLESGKTLNPKLRTIVRIVEALKLNEVEILDLVGWDIFPKLILADRNFSNRYKVTAKA